eukprot:Gb_24211 [translate_table: standard]
MNIFHLTELYKLILSPKRMQLHLINSRDNLGKTE